MAINRRHVGVGCVPFAVFYNMFKKYSFAVMALVAVAVVVSANHAWGTYHWARTANPFTLKLGDNVTSTWDGHLVAASGDWNNSSTSPLKTAIVSGGTDGRRCRATLGRVEVCNAKYGNNGWLGLASIWASGDHITKGTAKMNDTYFNTATYNTPAWKRFVVCQEIAHTFGLDHQDEGFNNPNLGSCMDYTSDPDGTLANPDQLSNVHPNAHDFEQLATIYAHLDGFTTLSALKSGALAAALRSAIRSADAEEPDFSEPREWGKVIRHARDGRSSLHVRDLGRGEKVFTFVIWAE